MIILGSRPSKVYFKDFRDPKDWDIWAENKKEYQEILSTPNINFLRKTEDLCFIKTNQGVVEFRHLENPTESDKIILNSIKENHFNMDTPIGLAQVPTARILYAIKKATSNHINREKHRRDVTFFESKKIGFHRDMYEKRSEEIKERIEKSETNKDKFFYEYGLPKRLEHDMLHDILCDVLDIEVPTYQLFISGATDAQEQLFKSLTHDKKISRFVEEIIVLMIERFLVPSLIKSKDIKNRNTWNSFYSINKSNRIPELMINKVCVTGLRGEQGFLPQFGKDNIDEIRSLVNRDLLKIKERDFPLEFYENVYKYMVEKG